MFSRIPRFWLGDGRWLGGVMNLNGEYTRRDVFGEGCPGHVKFLKYLGDVSVGVCSE